ncbi:MAG: hypothetical protein ACOX9E_16535, partial [Lentisphaeria bacterium]
APIGEKTGGVARQRRAAAMRDMPLIICANLRHLRIKNVCYQSLIARGRHCYHCVCFSQNGVAGLL